MTLPKVTTETDSRGRRWYKVGGTRLLGVSAIKDYRPKEALKIGAAKANAAYAVRNRDRLADTPKQLAYEEIRDAYSREWSVKAELGTEVHDACERVMRAKVAGGKPRFTIRSEVLPYVKNYLRWVREFSAVPADLGHGPMLERTVVNPVERYAGTLDGLWHLTVSGERTLAIVDTKSGASGVYGESALQQVAYHRAPLYVTDPDTGETAEMPEIPGGAYALWLRPNGYSMIPLDVSDATWQQFLRQRDSVEWDREHEKSLVGKPINQDPLVKRWTPPDLGE